MKKTIYILLFLALIAVSGYLISKKNIGTVNIPGDAPIDESGRTPLRADKVPSLPGFEIPAGFSLNIFAKNVPGARAIEIDPKGRILVSETSEGKIVALSDKNGDHVSDEQKVLASGLKKPHGLAMNCKGVEGCFLYVAERDELSRFPYDAEALTLGKKENLMRIASSIADRHFTRSILFLPPSEEDTLLISVGSSCDVCHEKDNDHASILSYNIKTGVKEVYAKGLRNAVFMALNPLGGKVFVTEMGRDNLGDNIPPDEINIIEKGKNYGWPICYGKNIHDTQFDKNTYIRNPCMEFSAGGGSTFGGETPSFIDLQAHSAPLGLAFIPEEGWSEEYRHNMLVAYHGSWNRSTPTGYKIVRIKMNAQGEYLGTEDFISGWLTKGGAKTGRPVDIKVLPGGVAYISDDSSGVIYRLSKIK